MLSSRWRLNLLDGRKENNRREEADRNRSSSLLDRVVMYESLAEVTEINFPLPTSFIPLRCTSALREGNLMADRALEEASSVARLLHASRSISELARYNEEFDPRDVIGSVCILTLSGDHSLLSQRSSVGNNISRCRLDCVANRIICLVFEKNGYIRNNGKTDCS